MDGSTALPQAIFNPPAPVESAIERFQYLASLKRWAPYKVKWNPKRGKWDKIPTFDVRTGLSTDDMDSWTELLTAVATAKENALHFASFLMTGGIEFDGLTLIGFDFDDITEDWTPPFDTYTERSPSGKGARAFAWAPTPWANLHQDTLDTSPPNCGHCEVYLGTAARFLTVTFSAILNEEIATLKGKDLLTLESWGLHLYQEKTSQAAPDYAGDGKILDLGHFNLTPDQKKLVAGTGDIDRSKVIMGFLIRLLDHGASQEDVYATITQPGPLWDYLMSHRNSEEKALIFARGEVANAWRESIPGKRANLASFNKKWEEKPVTTPEEVEVEDTVNSYQWELDNAPEVYAAYVEWFMQNGRVLHLGLAMQSADLFFQSCAGWNIKSPSGLRANKWSLVLAPSSGGKGAVDALAEEALRQLAAQGKGICPAIAVFEDTFSSGQAMWGHLMAVNQIIWFHPELASQLTQLSKAEQGVLFEKKETLLKLSDSSMKPTIQPPRYAISTQGKYKLQPINFGWFTSFGTGVWGDIRAFTDGSLKSGLLNRYEVDVIEGKVTIGNSGGYSPIPKVIVDWAKKTFMKDMNAAAKQKSLSAIGRAIEFSTYPEFDADWRAAMQWQLDGSEINNGIYGRSAEKMVKRGLIHAFAGGGQEISVASFEWGKKCVESRVKRFKNHFERHGGGAKSPEDALCRAFMQTFLAPKPAKDHARDGYLRMTAFRTFGGVAWMDSRDGWKENNALNWLKDNHFIYELDKEEKAEKGLRADARAFRKLRDYV